MLLRPTDILRSKIIYTSISFTSYSFAVLQEIRLGDIDNLYGKIQRLITKSTRPEMFCKKGNLPQVFSCEFWKNFKNTFLIEYLRWLFSDEFCKIFMNTFLIEDLRWLLLDSLLLLDLEFLTLIFILGI